MPRQHDHWFTEAYEAESHAFRVAVNEKIVEINNQAMRDRIHRGSSSGPMQVMTGVPGLACPLKIFTSDGRIKYHVIRAFRPFIARPDDEPRVDVETWYSDNDDLNQERLNLMEQLTDKYLIVNHKFYELGTPAANLDQGEEPVKGNGFGGRTIKFRRLTDTDDGGVRSAGPVMVTRNLWYSGVIAPAWRDRLPDNAVFLDGFDGPGVNY